MPRRSSPSAARADGLGPLRPGPLDLEAARTAIAPPDQAAEAWRRWLQVTDVDRGDFRHLELLPLARTNLPDGTMAGADEGIVKGLTRRSWYLQQRLLGVLGPALDALEGIDARPTMLGGLALAWSAYPNPGTRLVDGADVLVAPTLATRAEDTLAMLGWSASTSPSARPDATRRLETTAGDVLTLHRWAFAHRHGGHDADLRDDAVPIDLGGAGTRRRLADEDLLLFTVLEGLRTGRLVWLADAALLVRAGLDWDRVLARLTPAMAVRLLPALRLLHDELAVPVPAEVLRRLEGTAVPAAAHLRWWIDRHLRRGDRWFLYRSATRAAGRRPSVLEYVRLRRRDRTHPDPASDLAP